MKRSSPAFVEMRRKASAEAERLASRPYVVPGLVLLAIVFLLLGLGSFIRSANQVLHSANVGALVFTPDNQRLISAAGNGEYCRVINWEIPELNGQAKADFKTGSPYLLESGFDGESLLRTNPVSQNRNSATQAFKVDQLELLQNDTLGSLQSFSETSVAGRTLVRRTSGDIISIMPNSVTLKNRSGDTAQLIGAQLIGEKPDRLKEGSLSQNQRFLAVNGTHLIHVFDLTQGDNRDSKSNVTFDCGQFSILHSAISSDGELVAAIARRAAQLDSNLELVTWQRATRFNEISSSTVISGSGKIQILDGEEPSILVTSVNSCDRDFVILYSADGKLQQTIHEKAIPKIKCMSLSLDGDELVYCLDDGVTHHSVWRGDRFEETWAKSCGHFLNLALSEDGRFLAASDWSPAVSLFSADSGELVGVTRAKKFPAIALWWFGGFGIVSVAAGIGMVNRRLTAKRESNFKVLASELNRSLSFEELPSNLPGFRLPGIHSNGIFEYALLGENAVDPIYAVYRWEETRRNNAVTIRRPCVIYPFALSKFPDTLIRPKSITDKFNEFFGSGKIEFSGSKTLDQFSEHYFVESEDPELLSSKITEALAEYLNTNRGWTIETKNASVLIWWEQTESFSRNRYRPEVIEELREFFTDANRIFAWMSHQQN